MITLPSVLWTIYLIVAIYYTILCIAGITNDVRNNRFEDNIKDKEYHIMAIMIAVFWAIWYMYFLH